MIPATMGSPPTKGETGSCFEHARSPIKNTTPAFCYPSPSSVNGHDEPQTMSSVEIAKLTGKDHGDVLKDIRRILDEVGIDGGKFSGVYKGANGQDRPCFNLHRRECDLVIAGYSAKYRLAIIDRWQELEAKQQFNIPATLSGALMLAAKQAEQIEKQQVLIEQQKSAVEFHGTVCDAINAQTVEEVAKVLGTGRNRLFDWLRTRKIFKSDNLPYQDFIDRQYFRVTERAYKDKKGEAHTYTRTLVTGKGLAYIQSNFSAGAV